QGAWRTLDWLEERAFTLLETTDQGRVYGLDLTCPKPSAGQNQGAGCLYMRLGYAACEATDSVTVLGLAYDTLAIEITASASSVCVGEEVTYSLSRCGGVDSVVWYVNGQAVQSGFIGWEAAPANSYTYRPSAGDMVYVIGHAVWSPCVTEPFKISNMLNVEVLDGRTETAIAVSLTASADSVCGAGRPVYTVSGRGFDSLYWYANGQLAAVTDLLYGRTEALPAASAKDGSSEDRTASWERTPRLGTEGADSLYVVAVRRERMCRARAEQTSNVVSVYRRAQPEVRIAPGDTVLPQGEDFLFSASGATAYVWWTDLDNEIIGGNATLNLTVASEAFALYVMGYEPAYGPDSLAGGRITPPAPGDYASFGCRGYDRVAVRPSVQDENPLIYIPNTIVKSSVIPADRVFKVYGEDIVRV
ncbi:MAG: hypothetical protein K2H70_01205, partial [Bacteroidales bacterium]|nr:hypothetical protein [Bacteroidales bacterium]